MRWELELHARRMRAKNRVRPGPKRSYVPLEPGKHAPGPKEVRRAEYLREVGRDTITRKEA